MLNQQEMIQSLRAEIAKLQRVIDLLLDEPSVAEQVRRPGLPKGSGTRATSVNPEEFAPKKRSMSAEGKARIADAQKKRWAAQKGLAPGRPKRNEATATKRTSKVVPPKSAGKARPATAKKSSGVGKRTGSTQAKAQSASTKGTPVVAKKSPVKKGAAKGASKVATKRPAKQAAAAAPEAQTAA